MPAPPTPSSVTAATVWTEDYQPHPIAYNGFTRLITTNQDETLIRIEDTITKPSAYKVVGGPPLDADEDVETAFNRSYTSHTLIHYPGSVICHTRHPCTLYEIPGCSLHDEATEVEQQSFDLFCNTPEVAAQFPRIAWFGTKGPFTISMIQTPRQRLVGSTMYRPGLQVSTWGPGGTWIRLKWRWRAGTRLTDLPRMRAD